VGLREKAASERERKSDEFEKGVRKKYSKKLSNQEALIMRRLEKEGGYYFFEHGTGGVAKTHVLETELEGRDGIINGMKGVVMEVQDQKAELEEQKELLSKRKLDVDKEKKGLDSALRRKEKNKRYKLEMDVKENLEKQGFVALESGGLIATPSHAKVELQVREEQLSSAREESKRKDMYIAESLKSLADKDKVLSAKDRQLEAMRKKRKLEGQNRRRHEKAELAQETTRCLTTFFFSPLNPQFLIPLCALCR
jgi:hypothetical protein